MQYTIPEQQFRGLHIATVTAIQPFSTGKSSYYILIENAEKPIYYFYIACKRKLFQDLLYSSISGSSDNKSSERRCLARNFDKNKKFSDFQNEG